MIPSVASTSLTTEGITSQTGVLEKNVLQCFDGQGRTYLGGCKCFAGASDTSCLPEAPSPPGRYAAFSQVNARGEVVGISYVIESTQTEVHVVHDISEIPEHIRNAAIVITTKTLLPNMRRDIRRPNLIFEGNFRIDVGPLVGADKMRSTLLARNDHLKHFHVMYEPTIPRGPPIDIVDYRLPVLTNGSRAKATDSDVNLSSRKVVYIIGTADVYSGPSQSGRSVHNVEILNLQASDGKWKEYEQQLEHWRKEWAWGTGLSVKDFLVCYDNSHASQVAQRNSAPYSFRKSLSAVAQEYKDTHAPVELPPEFRVPGEGRPGNIFNPRDRPYEPRHEAPHEAPHFAIP